MSRFALAVLIPIALLAQPPGPTPREPRRQRAPLAEQFAYKETSRVNGGAAVVTAVASDGHHMARTSPTAGEIVDLDKETVTTVDYVKKQYSVVTFAELKKTAGDVQYKTSFTKPGKEKEISGFNVYEVIVKIQAGPQALTANLWLVSGISGYENILSFHRLGLPPGRGPLMSELLKETSKLIGIPMQQAISITGAGKPSEMTIDLSAFSGAPNPPSKFAVPAGFTKVRHAPR